MSENFELDLPTASFARPPIILTKLQPPLLRRSIVEREHLADKIRDAVERRLTLVCAGAGYGKTTLIASSLAKLDLPVVWYSLSRSDNDIVTFLTYLTEALDRQWPGFAQAVDPALASHGAPMQPADFVAACVNRLIATATGDWFIVLDDFQLVEETSSICAVMDQLILYAPAQVHFIIATRTAPAFACLPRMRAEGRAIEIGEPDLKFEPAQANRLFQQCIKLDLPEPAMTALVEQIEGWALGLLMAGQSIKARGDLSPLPQDASDRRVLFDYLSQEVLRQQPPHVVDFLTSSAILSYLEPALCDASLGRSDSARQIQRLEQHCLFVIPLPDGHLRYHRLFRDFLLQQLAEDPARLETLHRRAATYFEQNQNMDAAIYHWLQAGDTPQAARLIVTVSAEVLRAGRLDTLAFWLGQLPAAEFAERPELWVRWGQLCEASGEWDHALEYYEQAVQVYSARGDLLALSDVLRSKGHILDWRKGEYVEAERLHREALAYVGEEYCHQRAALLASLARDQLSAGNNAAAQMLYREALAMYGSDREGQLDTLLNPGSWLFHSQGEFSQAIAVLHRAEQLAVELERSPQLAESYNNLAVNLYFAGEYTESLGYADKALALGRSLSDVHTEAYALMNQANALEMLGRRTGTELDAQYEQALVMEQGLGNRRFCIAILVFMARLARRRGEYSLAVQRGQEAHVLATERGLRWLEGFALIQLGAAQTYLDGAEARQTLEQALTILGDCNDRYHLLAAHFWLTALHGCDRTDDAIQHLQECLRLAVGNHYDLFFQSEATAALPLLALALEHNLWDSYVIPILAHLGPDAHEIIRPLLEHPQIQVRRRAEAALLQMGVGLVPATVPVVVPEREIAAPALTIRALGNFSVWRGEQLIEERDWGRRKCKRLLKYLALSPDHTIGKDLVIEQLWGDADPQAGNANFYRALYHLRRVLEPQAINSCGSYITLEGGTLTLVDDRIARMDVDEFTRGIEQAHRLVRSGDRAQARTLLASAVQLYTDDLSTDDLYDDWVQPRREQLCHWYLDALGELADLAVADGEIELAASYLRQAFDKDCTAEETCLNLIHCLARIGQRSQALLHYATLEKGLANLDLTPSAPLRMAYQELVAGRIPAPAADWHGVPALPQGCPLQVHIAQGKLALSNLKCIKDG